MRLAGIFAAFAEEPIEGVEKCCQRFPGASRCNHQRMFASRRHMRGLRLDSGRLFKGAKKPVAVAGENTSGRSDEGSGLSAINAIPREYHAGCVE